MNENPSTKEQIILDLRGAISQILSISTSDVDKSENFWELFPKGNRYEPRQVTEFVRYVSNTYKVYLTERQWEAPTLPKLADHILERRTNPQHMLAQIRKDLANRKKGLRLSLIAFPIIFAVCGVGLFLLGSSPAEKWRGLLVCLGCIGVSESILLVLAYRENKKFNTEIEPVLKHYKVGH